MENIISRVVDCIVAKVILESRPLTEKNLEVLGKINSCLAKDFKRLNETKGGS